MADLKNDSMNSFLHFVYTVFLAILVAFFWGMGISAFYPGPKVPETTPAVEVSYKDAGTALTAEQKKAQLDFEQKQKDYNEKEKVYSRNVSVISLVLAVLTLVASVLIAGRVSILPNGLLLGSVFTLMYSIGRGFASEDAKFRFIIVTIGLLVTVFIGWWKFIKGKKS
jgi:hypothetical protein